MEIKYLIYQYVKEEIIMKKNLNVLSLSSNKKDDALQNLRDTDNAEIGRKCTDLMHVLEYNNV